MRYADEEKLHLFLDFLEVTYVRREKLFAAFSAEELIRKLRDRSPGLKPYLGDQFEEIGRARENFPAFLRDLEGEEVRALTLLSPAYPGRLTELAKPPFVLYAKGDLSLLERRAIAVVGRRACRPKSLLLTERFAGKLAQAGLVVVSGLAEGCDGAAHRAALKHGSTIAVLAGGFHSVYPQSNASLFAEIVGRGLVLCEHAPDFKPMRHHFVERNRIVAGLSEGTLITCAGEKSGTLSTANDCLELGRELFVLPGDLDNEDFKGNNRLIRELAGSAATSPEDILETLGIQPQPREEKSEALSPAETSVLDVLKAGDLHINEIARGLERSFSELAPLLSVMEIKGLVEKLPGNCFRVRPR